MADSIKIIFILNVNINTNSIKRINEFVKNGYNVEAYGFQRSDNIINKSTLVEIKTIGKISNEDPYLNRCGIINKGIRNVITKYKNYKKNECIFYLIGLDVAIFYKLNSKRPYIYEEPDLVHAYFTNKYLKYIFEKIDKYIIKHSILTVFRSEGFIDYHYQNSSPSNVLAVPNRLDPTIQSIPILKKREINFNNLKIGFVGFIRFNSIYNFCKVICTSFPNHEFHFYGDFSGYKEKIKFSTLNEYNNCYFHGSFKSPQDLPEIYSNIDLLIATYDIEGVNPKFAEPNKIYEAIYFNTPIVVSSSTFLASKVTRLGIGFEIDARVDKNIYKLISNISKDQIQEIQQNISKINKTDVLCINDNLFKKLRKELDNLSQDKNN